MSQSLTFKLIFYCLLILLVSSVECLSDLHKFNLTQPCATQLKELLRYKTSPWALQMLDASSKIPDGLLRINKGDIGSFDECIEARSNVSDIHGKYCLGNIAYASNNVQTYEKDNFKRSALFSNTPTSKDVHKTSYTWAACLPNECTVNDFNDIFSRLPLKVIFNEKKCQTYKDVNPEKTVGFYFTVSFFSIFLALIMVSSLYDYYCCQIKSRPKHQILIIFSAYTNASKLFAISKDSNQFHCLNGIKVISMFWVVIGHTHLMVLHGPVKNYTDILEWMSTLKSMLIVSAPFSVDTFFVMGGCLMTYSFLKAKKIGLNLNLVIFYLHRYLRLTPAVASMVLAYAFILPYLGSGPFWMAVKADSDNCKKHWWTTLLYVQNYVNVHEFCIAQSWYLSMDMQMYFLSPIVLLPLQKWPKTTLALLGLLNLGSMAYNYWLSVHYQLPVLLSRATSAYVTKYYFLTHTRVGPWLIGIILGYIIWSLKENSGRTFAIKNKIYWTLLWIISLAGIVTCVFVSHTSPTDTEYNEIGNALHIALVRPSWAICVSLLIYACVSGYGGPINWFLSLPIFQVAARFTYGIFIIHYILLMVFYDSTKVPLYFTEFNLMYSFWGVLCISTAISLFWILAFESPIIALEKMLFRKQKAVKS